MKDKEIEYWLSTLENRIKDIKKTAWQAGFKEGVEFILEKAMYDNKIGNDTDTEYPKTLSEYELMEWLVKRQNSRRTA